MEVLVFKDYEALSAAAANQMLDLIRSDPYAVLCLASGSSPLRAYQCFADAVQKEQLDCSKCTIIALDEWLGVSPEDSGSCHYFLSENLLNPLNIPTRNVHLFDGLTTDPEAECEKINRFITQIGGIDLMIVGVGMNGHIGFNEPGTPTDNYAHVIDLDEITRTVGQKYFDKPTLLQKGITMGLRNLLEAKKAILMANGSKKAEIIHKTVEGKVSTELPSSIMQNHTNALIMIDEEAAGKLNR